jgi:hypothetical protein
MKVSKQAERLEKRGLIRRVKMIDGRRVSYFLGERANKFMDIPNRLLNKSPGPHVLALRYSVLHYCCLGPRDVHPLTNEELIAEVPGFPIDALIDQYYLDPTANSLGVFRLVHPKRPPTKAANDAREFIEQRLSLGHPFDELVAMGRLLVVLLVYSDAQRVAVKRAVGRLSFEVGGGPVIEVRVHRIPTPTPGR